MIEPCQLGTIEVSQGGVSRGYVIGVGVHLYVNVCDPPHPPQSLNGTLVVKSPFQALAVDFSSNL